MVIVTGGAGFIGSNIIKSLNRQGIDEIIVVDDLTDGRKFKNISDSAIADYLDKDDFLERVISQKGKKRLFAESAIFHLGACSDTTEWNGRYMMQNNYEYSKILLDYCLKNQVQFLYASSAAVYGGGKIFKEEEKHEAPLNVYGYSKYLFDQYVRKILPKNNTQVTGFRYFNVYGPRETHKGKMASVAFHHAQEIKNQGTVKLFEGSDGYADGEQRRDFVYVEDVAAINLWFYDRPKISGIFNVGTGKSQSFNDVANAVIGWHGKGSIEYIPFPEMLKERYQSFTEADLNALREVGCDINFRTVEQGVRDYLNWLDEKEIKE